MRYFRSLLTLKNLRIELRAPVAFDLSPALGHIRRKEAFFILGGVVSKIGVFWRIRSAQTLSPIFSVLLFGSIATIGLYRMSAVGYLVLSLMPASHFLDYLIRRRW